MILAVCCVGSCSRSHGSNSVVVVVVVVVVATAETTNAITTTVALHGLHAGGNQQMSVGKPSHVMLLY